MMVICEKSLKLGRKIRDRLNLRGHKLDYFAGTIIAEMIEKENNTFSEAEVKNE
jgi:hypothetical protein